MRPKKSRPPDHPPLGYLYAKLPFNGKLYEYLYLPNQTAATGKVPLLVIKNGKIEFDVPSQLTLTRKLDGKGAEFEDPSFTPSARMANMYAQGYAKVLGKGESQLHHLVADNVARDSLFFQEAMKRGLFGLDEKFNIVEVAVDDKALKKAQQLLKDGKTTVELPPLVHRGPHDQADAVTEGVIEDVLRQRGIEFNNVSQIKALSNKDAKSITEEIQITLRERYRKGNMPKKNGSQLATNGSGESQWA